MTYDRNRQQALKAYREKQENITRLIEDIRGKLDADAKQPDITWASVGSLGHVEELLRELDEFLS